MNKMMFYYILIFSTFIVISTNSWFHCWMGLEINLMSFIPLISNSYNMLRNEASLKYFLIQSITSINLLFFILLLLLFNKLFMPNYLIMIMINLSLLMKMGSAPFYFWFPNIIEGLSWMNCFFLFTWQKISPLIMLMYYFNNNFLIFIMILNSIIGSLKGFIYTSLRKILSFSSINNLGWLLAAYMFSENSWFLYFSIYSFIIMMMCFLFYIFNSLFINQLFMIKINPIFNFFFMINFFSLSGLPPFLGFFPKWFIINLLTMKYMYVLIFIFILMNLILLLFYIRIIYSSIMFNYSKIKWLKIYIKINTYKFILLINMISILGLIMSTFFF